MPSAISNRVDAAPTPTPTRRSRREQSPRRAPHPHAPAATDSAALTRPEPRGFILERKRWQMLVGMHSAAVRGAPSTTRQAEVLNTAVIAAPTDSEGILVGRDLLSRTPVAHDPITAYRKGIIDSPNVCVFGRVGSGKSSLLKTVYVCRPLVLRNRRVVVVDKKTENGEGEYAPLARAVGVDPIRLMVGSEGSTINLLDPVLTGGTVRVAEQFALLQAATVLANNGNDLKPWEAKALRVAHLHALAYAADLGRTSVMPDVTRALGSVVKDPTFRDLSRKSKERLEQAGLTAAFILDRLISDELHGLFDTDTTADVRLGEKLTVFDISRLPDEGPASSLSMMVANKWLLGHMFRNPGRPTNFVTDEGWHLVAGPAGRFIRSNSKLSRGLGLSNIAALHQLADVPPSDPAIAFVKEARTVHIYGQSVIEDAEACETTFGLARGSANELMHLAKGIHYVKIGNRPEIKVEHVRSPWEVAVTNTDTALAGGARREG